MDASSSSSSRQLGLGSPNRMGRYDDRKWREEGHLLLPLECGVQHDQLLVFQPEFPNHRLRLAADGCGSAPTAILANLLVGHSDQSAIRYRICRGRRHQFAARTEL